MLDPMKNCGKGCGQGREAAPGACCIDTYRIYDSGRNQECLENLRMLVTDEGQEIIDRASAIRIKSVKVLPPQIQTDEMPFNKGYFQVNIRYFFHCVLDCCTGPGTGQDAAGICVYDKSSILYGGEGNVSVYKSDISASCFCPTEPVSVQETTNLPRAVVEVADPVALRLNVLSCENAHGFGIQPCGISELPDKICSCFSGRFSEQRGGKTCFLSLGLFSIVRIERPAQLVVPACDACIPEKSGEYDLPRTDPCALFLSMEFPFHEFYPEIRNNAPTHSLDSCETKEK